jgi:ParB/RepB/Spo0J family partition protein
MKPQVLSEERYIPLDELVPNPANPRYEAGDVTELADQIDAQGQLQPAIVVQTGPHKFMFEDGYRRWVAMKARNYPGMSCIVRIPDPEENLVLRELVTALITSSGKPLSAMERAWAYERMKRELGMSKKEIAAAVGLSPSTISNSMELLALDRKSQLRVHHRQLKVGEARIVIRQQKVKVRKKQGHGQPGATWEPPHFTRWHPQAPTAEAMCDAREHSARRREGSENRRDGYRGACQQCWEDAIRQDQVKIDEARFKLEHPELNAAVPFPWPLDHPMTTSQNNITDR